jgi:flavin reductase (DIM6/NTAB) family NADH-FMN oxidoreductase RutF
MLRTRECVLNLPSVHEVDGVNRLARTTGSNPVPAHKLHRGYRFEPDKFGMAGFTPLDSEVVAAPRVQECPVQLEAVVEGIHALADDDVNLRGGVVCIEVRIVRVHVDEALLMPGLPNRIDPDLWQPLIMSFQKFYGLGAQQVADSTLAKIDEALYRSPDVDRARAVDALRATSIG